MSYENIGLILVGIAFILLYLWDKEKGNDIEDKNMLLRHVYLAAGISFLYMALILNFNVSSALTNVYTVSNTVGLTAQFNTTYTYSNTLVTIDPSVIIYTVIYFIIIVFVLARAIFDMLDIFTDHS